MAVHGGRLRRSGRRPAPDGSEPAGLRTEREVQAAYDLYGGELLGFASRALDDRQLAEDVVQEAFVSAWRSPRGFEAHRGSLRTWLFAITRNGIVDALRRRRVRWGPGGSSWDDLSEPPAVLDPVDQLLEQIQLAEALRRLSPDHREAVVGVHYGGRTCAELAHELGVPASTMRSRLYYGMRTLRMVLEENGWLAS
ncbi:RNA polymerase sigma-70 factor, ECF subfamily [Promicromonospora umidemergens]|uniref:sigma-70 family RNA polymerase sigma factor n=1 Tax=Promicromonospora umidemergens TaxID=629679 RepID=UPI0020A60343|nr:sigma-70 family RNA polymerase sigma factor [Promicromonospora umidemergens]MCP2281172.1 RNA polymerase sigma-70 factor, ECF subfamily [Promicromonospora umidemergens]